MVNESFKQNNEFKLELSEITVKLFFYTFNTNSISSLINVQT